MQRRITRQVAPAVIALVFVCAKVQAQGPNTDRGAILGGLSGALIGGAIGDNNGEAAAGALIGSAIGLFSGAALGSSADQQESQWQATQRYQQHVAVSQAVSLVDVVRMTQSGLSDTVISNQIRQRGVQQKLQVRDVIYLQQLGVSEPVITCLQQTPLAGRVVNRIPSPAARPVIVERHHYISPRPYWHPPRYYPPRHYGRGYHHQPGVRIGFSFGN